MGGQFYSEYLQKIL